MVQHSNVFYKIQLRETLTTGTHSTAAQPATALLLLHPELHVSIVSASFTSFSGILDSSPQAIKHPRVIRDTVEHPSHCGNT